MKILPVGAELFQAYTQTDKTKLIFDFWNSVKVAKTVISFHIVFSDVLMFR